MSSYKGWINKYIPLSILVLTMVSCIQLKNARLYDGVEVEAPTPKPKSIDMVVEPTIFKDDITDVWGLEDVICKEAHVVEDIVHSGTKAIKVTWNRYEEGCPWAGIGIGWDGYAGKDLSEIMDYAAIQFFVRSDKGKMFGLPIVLTLQDYSGGLGFAYTANQYFERSSIDENWQKVIVPLKDFDIDIENLDPTNIKQLQIELQQNGSIYLDDISLIFFTPEPQEPWMNEEILPDPTAFPISIFENKFINNNSWGLISDKCQTIKIEDESVHIKWDKQSDCKLISFGASWNKWRPVDLSTKLNSGAIRFEIKKLSSLNNAVSVGFEDYDRQKSSIDINKFIENTSTSNDWRTVIVPFSSLPKSIDFSRVKHLFFDFSENGEILVDNISLTNI
jgi:hypothetical protein